MKSGICTTITSSADSSTSMRLIDKTTFSASASTVFPPRNWFVFLLLLSLWAASFVAQRASASTFAFSFRGATNDTAEFASSSPSFFSRVQPGVIRWCHDFQILDPIVSCNFVFVVNHFGSKQFSTEIFFHYETMFKLVLFSADVDIHVPGSRINNSSATECGIFLAALKLCHENLQTRFGAGWTSIRPNAGRNGFDYCFAYRAMMLDALSVEVCHISILARTGGNEREVK